MKIQPDKFDVQSVNAYGADWLSIDGVKFSSSLIFSSRGLLTPWHCTSFAALVADDFVKMAQFEPEVIILGTGLRLQFPSHQLLRPLISAKIGWEIMDNAAACRTYNILAQEGRHVLCAIIF